VTERDLQLRPLEVLIVEDDKIFSDALSMFLDADSRFHVLGVARDVEAALAEARERTFDVALVDVRLERGEDGFALVEALRELHPAVVAVMMSGLDRAEFEARALESGAQGVLQKTDLALEGRDAIVDAYLGARA
jgi:two-component system chemotaxis response regulator CheB